VSSLSSLLSARIEAVAGIDPELRPATKPQFGHYQSNVALRLANSERKSPREVAANIVARLQIADLCEAPEIAGPGFINLRLRTGVLTQTVTDQIVDSYSGVSQVSNPQVVVIDYSSPNVAKQMHVGHLRSTVIGDCLRRVLTGVGHHVVPQSHIGDWGTQFGMLVEHIVDEGIDASSLTLPEADELYARASARFRADEDFAECARRRVVALQAGDEVTREIWHQLINISLVGFNAAYRRLGVLLTDDDLAGESTYNDELSSLVAELERDGTAVIDDGALCVFVDGFAAPMIVRKRDGGFGYAATDLAAIRRRVRDLHANRIIYVVDTRQSDHFDLVFAVARKAGFLPDDVITEHVAFGTVLGTDGKPFKTREGTAVNLNTLLDAAEAQAAPPVALAAIKYADLSNGLNKDYVFDVSRMVQTTGNTGPYLQYAHARVTQVLRKGAARGYGEQSKVLMLEEPAEQTLALLLTRFGDTVDEVARTLQPHRLCNYLYDLSGALAIFYEQCPVLQSSGAVRDSRLALCLATKRVLADGLTMLGIEPLERM
jgi:arginyl-tRNA synthetase